MESREQYSRLVGYAAGVLAAAPSGPPARTDTARAYRRYYARWQAGERFDECPRGTRAYAAAAVRWSAAEELRTAIAGLESAMEDGDEGAAEHAAIRVEELRAAVTEGAAA